MTSTSSARQVTGSFEARSSAASERVLPSAWPARPTVRWGTTSGNSPCQGGVSKRSAKTVVSRLNGLGRGGRQPQHPLPEPADPVQGVVEGLFPADEILQLLEVLLLDLLRGDPRDNQSDVGRDARPSRRVVDGSPGSDQPFGFGNWH